MKVIIAGDRECIDYDLLERSIKESGFDITEIVSGGARGADALGEMWAKKNNVPVKKFPAKWDDIKAKGAVVKVRENPWTHKKEKYNTNAGFTRNSEMILYADAVIALQPNGKTPGTQHTIKEAIKKGLSVYVYEKEDKDYEYKF